MRAMNRKNSMLLAITLIAGGLLAAAPAYADNAGTVPSGCSISPNRPTILVVSEARRVTFGGSANCNAASSIDFRLVHNFTTFPDVRVRQVNIAQSQASYTGSTCNNGGSKQYYSEIALRGLSTTVQRVSSTVTLTTC